MSEELGYFDASARFKGYQKTVAKKLMGEYATDPYTLALHLALLKVVASYRYYTTPRSTYETLKYEFRCWHIHNRIYRPPHGDVVTLVLFLALSECKQWVREDEARYGRYTR